VTALGVRPQPTGRRGLRLSLEQLEDRTVPSNFIAATASDLIADIKAANQQGGSNTITLVAPTTSPYALTAVDNTTDGATGLPVIAANDNLTIVGNGDTIERSTAAGTPAFRLFHVAAGASLTLQNLTLQNGLAQSSGQTCQGGAIYNQGSLDLNGVNVQNNNALLGGGGVYVASGTVNLSNDILRSNLAAFGGGLSVASGTVSLSNDTLSANRATGEGWGGGLFVLGGTVTLTNDTLSSNTAVSRQGLPGSAGYFGRNGGNGGPGGTAYGGGVCVFGGTVTLNNDTLTGNLAQGGRGGTGGNVYNSYVAKPGNGGPGGNGYGGGLYVDPYAMVTLANDMISSNTAQGGEGGAGGRAPRLHYVYRHPPVVYFVYGSSGAAGLGEGGGLYIDTLAAVCLDAFTQAHVTNNSPDNIVGPFKHC
jgi:hypothetical protein